MECFRAIFVVVGSINQRLKPDLKLSCLIDLLDPKLHHVQVVEVKEDGLRGGLYLEIVLVFLEEPLRLSKQAFNFYQVLQLYQVVGLVREFVHVVVGDEHSLNRVQVDVPRVAIELQPVDFHKLAFNPFEGCQTCVSVFRVLKDFQYHLQVIVLFDWSLDELNEIKLTVRL